MEESKQDRRRNEDIRRNDFVSACFVLFFVVAISVTDSESDAVA